eukprot:2311065-Amphidinium_carterae.1
MDRRVWSSESRVPTKHSNRICDRLCCTKGVVGCKLRGVFVATVYAQDVFCSFSLLVACRHASCGGPMQNSKALHRCHAGSAPV